MKEQTTQNIVKFHPLQKQVHVQEIPEVRVKERIQEQIVPERIAIPVPPIVEGSFPSVDESASPVYNQVHQIQIAAEKESIKRVQQHR